ncbi:SpoIIE family protein phosphatase [Methylocaldum sp.]|uniref:SpoIIE family protein phosphatase n=1 Tax=Methylocaldum sp. TaxID=1969727 RepID=UPI002D59DABC|nr:SpoIIE family protein phosphatase [Methylocaldum sp.]HYE34070.1 SpoIIE family protein phosphatase [Methylocaldum sp.]
MNDTLREFAKHYASELRNYLAGAGEAGLQRAYELGRLAVESGLGVLDIESIYREALASVLEGLPSAEESRHTVAMAAEFWAESLAPFEMTHRGFREANDELRRLNQTLKGEITERKRAEAALQKAHDDLERRVRLRTAELAQANAELGEEITERKHYEAELRLHDRAIEASSVGIIITDARQPNYPIIYANPAFAQMIGFSREELIGRNPRILQGPDTDPEAIAEIRQALREGRDCHLTLKNYRKDGTPFWNELFLSPVRDNQGNLTHYIGTQTDVTELRRAEEERHEMEIAKQIQLSLLPGSPLQLPGALIAGYCLPATHVGGDYFDYFWGPDTIDLVVADVSGHSMGAALVMAEARSTLRAEALHRQQAQHGLARGTGEILRALNALLYDDLSRADLFITMFYMKYHRATRQLSYANAGHNPPLLLRCGETACRELDAEGLIFGVIKEVAFEEKGTVLDKGDLVLLYTDGVTEAQNPEGKFFGADRLSELLAAQGANTPQEIINTIIEALQTFCRSHSFADDVSMVVLKVT